MASDRPPSAALSSSGAGRSSDRPVGRDGEGGAGDRTGFVRGLSTWDSTMIVAGSMIGSGIFIVPADIARQVGSSGWLLATWLVTGLLTIAAALSYGELAGMMPRTGGQYVYLREAYSPMWGFLYGWTFFLVIQTGTIAAVAVGFARYLGVLVPWISPTEWIVPPIDVSAGYAISLSRQQLVGIAMIALLTWLNTRGLRLGQAIQNVFTSAKTLSLIALIVLGAIALDADVVAANFERAFAPRDPAAIQPGLGFLPAVSAAGGALGLIVALGVAQVGSLFSADAWNNITFTADEVKDPRRTIPLSMVLGIGFVIVLYLLANAAYLAVLPLESIQHAPDDRVATAALQSVLGGAGAIAMAAAIVVSTFGCNNGLILAGARVTYAMARDGLFFRACGKLSERRVPAVGLALQAVWAGLLVVPRTRTLDASGAPVLDASGAPVYGNLYGNLLDYVVFAVLLFYVLTILGLFRLRRTRPDEPRPYRAFGYPWVPAAYVVLACAIMLILVGYRTQMTWPGLLIALTGIPVYLMWRRTAPAAPAGGGP